MIVTDSFVFIHQPKTGGTFVRSMLERLYPQQDPDGGRYRRGRLGKKERMYQIFDQHALAMQIPPDLSDRKLLATVRNPYDRYVSQYEFNWLQRHPDCVGNVERLQQRWPEYPDFRFERFVEFWNVESMRIINFNFDGDDVPGRQTMDFFIYYSPQPILMYPSVDEPYLRERRYREFTDEIHFLQMENLNVGLFEFLLQQGFRRREIEFILEAGKVRPPGSDRSEAQKWQSYYTPELKARIRRKERMLFDLFPEYDV